MSFNLPGYLTLSGITVAMPEPYNAVVPLNIALSHPKDDRAQMEMEVRNAAAKIANSVKFAQKMESSGLTGSIPISINGTTFSGGVWNGGSINIFGSGGVGQTNPFGSVRMPSIQPNQTVRPSSSAGGAQAGSSGRLNAPDSEDYASQFNLRLSLIEEYCDKWGKTVDVDAIKERFASDKQAGVEYCDDILNNKFNQSRLQKLVHKKYDNYNKSRQEQGKAVSDKWVEAVLKGGLDKLDVSSGGVTKDNVLDVIGTFATNKQVKNGKVSLYNVFESPQMTANMIEIMKAKADEALLNKSVPDDVKNQILSKIESLRTDYDKYQDTINDKNPVEFNKVRGALSKVYMDLFGILRTDEAKHNDEVAPQVFGLPKDSKIKFNDQTIRAQNEISSYKHRRKLSTSI